MKNKNTFTKTYAALALALPLSWGIAPETMARPMPTPCMLQQNTATIIGARMINPTTVEILYANQQVLTLDFYGSNIVRLFQDNQGGIVRNPEAKPEAEILVKNPRREAGHIDLSVTEPSVTIRTSRLTLTIDRTSGLMNVVKNSQPEQKIMETLAPFTFVRLQSQPDLEGAR